MRVHDFKSNVGSFLISTALFLVAASMIGVVLLRMYQMFDYNKKLHTSQQRLAAVQESLDDYYARTGRLPYPSAPAANTDSANFGREAVTTAGIWASSVGTVRVDGRLIGGVPQRVIIGTLPTRVLGLSDSYAIDKWGNKLIYAVTEDYADGTPVLPTVDRGGITVQDEFNRSATSEQGNAIYIVLTHGPDKRGAYNLNGQRPIPCPAAGLAVENCDGDAVFVNTVNKSYDPNIGPNTYTYSAVYRAFPAGHDWVVGAWGPCDSVDCSTGNQPRTVDCRATNNTLLLDAVCLADRGPKPPLTQACAAAFTCAWEANGFTPVAPLCASSPAGAPVTCGGGFRERQVLCRRSDGLGMLYHNPWGALPVATPAMQATANAQCGAVPPRPPHQETCLPAACVCGPANTVTFAVEPPNAQKCAAPAPNVVAPATGGAPAWQWTWRCNGGSTFAADDSPLCSANRQAQCGAANGVGSAVAPAAGLCNVGNPSAVAGVGPWTWTCTGTGAGNSVPCNAPLLPPTINGTCGPANGVATAVAPAVGLCATGTSISFAGAGPWTWTCDGSGLGHTDAACNAPMPVVNGVCGIAHGTFPTAPPLAADLCAAGTATAPAGSYPWTWDCTGSGGGATVNCSTNITTSGFGCVACPWGSIQKFQGADWYRFCLMPPNDPNVVANIPGDPWEGQVTSAFVPGTGLMPPGGSPWSSVGKGVMSGLGIAAPEGPICEVSIAAGLPPLVVLNPIDLAWAIRHR